MNNFAKHNDIKFQAESWERYGHNGYDNRKHDCSVTLCRIYFDFSLKELQITSHTFTTTTGYYLFDEKIGSVDRKDVNKVYSRRSFQEISSVKWVTWCEQSRLEKLSALLIRDIAACKDQELNKLQARVEKVKRYAVPEAQPKQ